MRKVNIDDLKPTPFFARYLEGQELKSVRGGSEWGMPALPQRFADLLNGLRERLGGLPGKFPLPHYPAPKGGEVYTTAYPSDSDDAVVPFDLEI